VCVVDSCIRTPVCLQRIRLFVCPSVRRQFVQPSMCARVARARTTVTVAYWKRDPIWTTATLPPPPYGVKANGAPGPIRYTAVREGFLGHRRRGDGNRPNTSPSNVRRYSAPVGGHEHLRRRPRYRGIIRTVVSARCRGTAACRVCWCFFTLVILAEVRRWYAARCET